MDTFHNGTVVLFDNDCQFLWSSSYRYLNPDQVLGKSAWDLIVDDKNKQIVRQKFLDCKETGEPQQYSAVSEINGQLYEFNNCIQWIGIDRVAYFCRVNQICHEMSLLSQQELQALRLLSQGLEPKEIADHMGIKYNTAHSYLRRIRTKLEIEGNSELIVFALKNLGAG